MDSEQTSGRPDYIWWLLPLLVLVSGIVLTALIAPRSLIPVEAMAQGLSTAHHRELSRELKYRLSETLNAASDLARSGQTDLPVRAEEFLARFPAITGVELLEQIPHAQRSMVERTLSERSGHFIRLETWTEPQETRIAEPAGQYLVISHARFQSADSPSASGIGLVANSVPHWRGALKRALEQGQIAATSMTTLHRNGDYLAALRIFLPVGEGPSNPDNSLMALVIRPYDWLNRQLADLHDLRWQVEVHDISQHARQPLITLPADSAPADGVAPIRSTLTVADRQWMISTYPSSAWLHNLNQQVLWPAWLTGLTITLLATGLTAWAVWLTLKTNRLLGRRTRRARYLGQQLDNTRVEKNILHHSLQESDRRTRDLIELGAGIFAELDEGRHIGYISPHVATLLDIPSTELMGKALDALFPEDAQIDLAMAFDAARRDQSIQRLDSQVITRHGEDLPIALRIKALKDPLSGCSGYRVSLTPRQ